MDLIENLKYNSGTQNKIKILMTQVYKNNYTSILSYYDPNNTFHSFSVTHLLVNSNMFPSNSHIELHIGNNRMLKLELSLLEKMGLVSVVEDNFVIRIPFDYLFGNISLKYLQFHHVRINFTSNDNNINIDDVYILFEEFTSNVPIFNYYRNIDCDIRDVTDLNMKHQINDEYTYRFRTYFNNPTLGFYITCNTKELANIVININGNNYPIKYTKDLLNKNIINDSLLWLELYDVDDCIYNCELDEYVVDPKVKSTVIINLSRIDCLDIYLNFNVKQSGNISINAYNLYYSLYYHNMIDTSTDNKMRYIIPKFDVMDNRFYIKQFDNTVIFHNMKKPNKLIINGIFNEKVKNYIVENNIDDIITTCACNKIMELVNLTKLKIVCPIEQSINLNNLPMNLKVLNILRICNYIRSTFYFENLPSTLEKLKLSGMKVDQRTKIPLNLKVINYNQD